MTTIASAPERVRDGADARGKMFFLLLAAATMIPLLGQPFVPRAASPALSSFVLACWMAAGFGHVMATLWFGLDEDYRPVVARHPFRMVGAIFILPMLTVSVALASETAARCMFALYTAWLVHHYNRQTYGIIGLAAAHDGYGRLPRAVDLILHVTTIAGSASLVTKAALMPQDMSAIAAPALVAVGWYVSLAATLLACTSVAILIVRDAALRRCPTMMMFLVLSALFYLPSLLPGSPIVNFLPFAMAHGLQYIILMLALSGRSSRGLMGLALTLAIIVVLGTIAWSIDTNPWLQLYSGVVIWHFLADARLWRMRDPIVRTIVRTRFDFLFRPSSTKLHPVTGKA
jgi:hypothetical protein